MILSISASTANSDPSPATLTGWAVAVLEAANPAEKVRLTRDATRRWNAGMIAEIGAARPSSRPARPERPALLPPRDMPKRRVGGARGRIALLHALAHIELNAIDLAWDMIARFAGPGLPRDFATDWLAVAAEEAEHHALLQARLSALGAAYGDLPAHDGLWEAAEATAHDLLARLAVVPLVLEARGLDVTPAMTERLERLGDAESAAILRRIHRDEIGHVACGFRWFERLCESQGLEPESTYQAHVRRYFRGALKPPFDTEARAAARFPASYYTPLAAQCGTAMPD